jgi:hypothetical protein
MSEPKPALTPCKPPRSYHAIRVLINRRNRAAMPHSFGVQRKSAMQPDMVNKVHQRMAVTHRYCTRVTTAELASKVL